MTCEEGLLKGRFFPTWYQVWSERERRRCKRAIKIVDWFKGVYKVMITAENKSQLIQGYARGSGDTGSPEVQCALITARVQYLTTHLNEHPKDLHSRYGLLKMLGQRRRLLDYVKRKDPARYLGLIQRLGIRK